MSDDSDPVKTIMDRTFAELAALFAKEAGVPAAVCTNWVVIAEWSTVADDEGAKWISRWFDDRHEQNVARLKTLTGDELVRVLDFRGMFQFPAVVFVTISLNHSIHHRGQLSMYLRPMGARVPSIYGESYDARLAREQGKA